jgi:hypothetical protein
MLLDLALTEIIEVGLFVAVGLRDRWFLLVAVLINLATNLSLHLAVTLWPVTDSWPVFALMEAAVVIIEWLALAPMTAARSRLAILGWVALANLASFGAGLLLPL